MAYKRPNRPKPNSAADWLILLTVLPAIMLSAAGAAHLANSLPSDLPILIALTPPIIILAALLRAKR